MPYFEHKYFNTYYYSNIVSNILSKDIELIGFISNFFADDNVLYSLALPFQTKNAFHCFLRSVIADFLYHDMCEYDEALFRDADIDVLSRPSLYIELALDEYDLGDYKLDDYVDKKEIITYADVEAYHEELMLIGIFEELCDKIANEVFYLMFNNRKALLQFNNIVSEYMPVNLDGIEEKSIRKLFTRYGYLKRVRIPEWCKKAVFFRDRGKCCFCPKDLSGILNINTGKQFDHIVPLARGGLNDVSNIQLLCAECNNKKNKYEIVTTGMYEAWY